MNGKESSFKGGGTHEEFLALCALSTSGELSDSEHRKLQEHLLQCDECRDAKQLFEEVVDEVMPAIAADKFEDNDHGALRLRNWHTQRIRNCAHDGTGPAAPSRSKPSCLKLGKRHHSCPAQGA